MWGIRKKHLLAKFQTSLIYHLITTCPNRCENWVFLIFLETGSSYGADSEDQSYRQPLYTHLLFRSFFHYLNPISNTCENTFKNRVFFIFLVTGWFYLKQSEEQNCRYIKNEQLLSHTNFDSLNPR